MPRSDSEGRSVPSPIDAPTPCPRCASIGATATHYPNEPVVWWVCQRCKHTWCVPLPASPPARDDGQA